MSDIDEHLERYRAEHVNDSFLFLNEVLSGYPVTKENKQYLHNKVARFCKSNGIDCFKFRRPPNFNIGKANVDPQVTIKSESRNIDQRDEIMRLRQQLVETTAILKRSRDSMIESEQEQDSLKLTPTSTNFLEVLESMSKQTKDLFLNSNIFGLNIKQRFVVLYIKPSPQHLSKDGFHNMLVSLLGEQGIGCICLGLDKILENLELLEKPDLLIVVDADAFIELIKMIRDSRTRADAMNLYNLLEKFDVLNRVYPSLQILQCTQDKPFYLETIHSTVPACSSNFVVVTQRADLLAENPLLNTMDVDAFLDKLDARRVGVVVKGSPSGYSHEVKKFPFRRRDGIDRKKVLDHINLLVKAKRDVVLQELYCHSEYDYRLCFRGHELVLALATKISNLKTRLADGAFITETKVIDFHTGKQNKQVLDWQHIAPLKEYAKEILKKFGAANYDFVRLDFLYVQEPKGTCKFVLTDVDTIGCYIGWQEQHNPQSFGIPEIIDLFGKKVEAKNRKADEMLALFQQQCKEGIVNKMQAINDSLAIMTSKRRRT